MELTLEETWERKSCPGLITSMDPPKYSFECLEQDHPADEVKMALPCIECRAFPLVRQRKHWDYVWSSHIELVCKESEVEMGADDTTTNTLNCSSLLPFVTLTAMEVHRGRKTSASPRCPLLQCLPGVQKIKNLEKGVVSCSNQNGLMPHVS